MKPSFLNRNPLLSFCAVTTASFAAVISAKAQVVTFDTSANTAAQSIATTFNATQQAAGVSGTPTLSRTTLTASTGAAGSFYSNGANNNTNTLDLTKSYVGFAVTPSAGNVIFATAINFNSQGSNSSPNSYAIAYSTDNFATSSQTTFTGTTSTSAVARSFDITDLITNDTLTTRLYNYGATSISTGTAATTGPFRVITPTVSGSTVSAAAGAIALAANTEVRNSTALTLGGVISGAFSLTKTGAGTLSLTNTGNTYSGGTTINAGTVAINGPNILGSTAGTLTINNGIFQVTTIGGTGTGISSSRNIVLGNANSTIQVDTGLSYTATSAALVSGIGTLNKTGVGDLGLAGANTYTGGTIASAGTLLVTNTAGSATGTGSVTVNNSGTILTGTGAINASASGANITVNGILSPGAASAGTAGTINLAAVGGLTLSSSSTLRFDITDNVTKDLVALSSTGLTLSGGTLALNLPDMTSTGIDYAQTYTLFSGVSSFAGSGFGSVTGYDTSDFTASFALSGSDYNLSFTAVPEPSTWVGAGLIAGLAAWSQRKRFAGLVNA